jgi:hypothetical protein
MFLLLLATVAAIETKNATPNVSVNASEPINLTYVKFTDASGVEYDLQVQTASGTTPVPFSFFTDRFIAHPIRWLENAVYTFGVRVQDQAANARAAEFPFLVNATGQHITLLVPLNGGTNDTKTPLVIGTEFPSICKWIQGNLPITDPQLYSLAMHEFNSTGEQRHQLDRFYEALGVTPTENVDVFVSVTCNDSSQLSSRVFSVTYITATPSVEITVTPNPIVDISNPIATITAHSNQDVWCTVNNKELFGPKTSNAFRRTLQGTYTDTAPLALEKTLNIACENRVGKLNTTAYVLSFRYTDVPTITVTSASVSATKSYQLTFTTNKLSTCTAQHNGTNLTVNPSQQPTTSFSATATNLGEGKHVFAISCMTALQTTPTKVTHTVIVDTARPTLTLIVPDPSCNLRQLPITFNVSDPTPSSGEGSYNYSLSNRTDEIIEWTETDNKDEVLKNLRLYNNTQYTVKAVATDAAGNPSAIVQKTFTASTGDEGKCDKEAPELTIVSKPANNASVVYAICRDESACTDTYYCTSIVGVNKECAVKKDTKLLFSSNATFSIYEPSTVCCEATDVNGNLGKAQRNVFITANKTTTNETENNTPEITTCTNGVKDGYETDVDCGGAFCTSAGKICAVGKQCGSPLDCSTKYCDRTTRLCGAASCTDGIQDGGETGVDCGGPCAACAATVTCSIDIDCDPGYTCEDNSCVETVTETPEENYTEEPANVNMLGIILILSGLLCMVSGIASLLLLEQPKKKVEPQYHEPIATFDEKPLAVPKQSVPQRKIKRKNHAQERVRMAISDFETPDDLANKETVSHVDIEKAYDQFDAKTFKDTTKQLLASGKIEKHKVAIALADIAAKKESDPDAIDDLRKEFGIEDNK